MAQYKNPDNGTWFIQCTNPTTGKRTTIRKNPLTKMPFKTKKEAKVFECDFLMNKFDINMTFGSLFEKYHQYFLLKNSVDADLMSLYKTHLHRFANKRITSFGSSDVINFQSELKSKGYSPAYINKIISHFNTILNYGVSQGFLSQNKCRNVKALKIPVKAEDEQYWTPVQFKKAFYSVPDVFTGARDQDFIQKLMLFGYYTGCRIGEIRALTWEKVDFEHRTLNIDQHVAKKNTDKTGRKNNDRLIIYMDNNVFALLKSLKEKYQYIEGFNRKSYVFPSPRDGFNVKLGANTANRWMKKLAEFNDLPHIKFHGLRHSCASYLISVVGLSPYEVADRLGDTVEVTLKIYASLFNESKRIAADKINRYSGDFEELNESNEKRSLPQE